MKIIKRVKFATHGIHFTCRRITALEGLELQSLFQSEKSEKDRVKDMIELLNDVVIDAVGFRDESDSPIKWESLDAKEKEYILGYNFFLVADLFAAYMGALNPTEEQEKK